MLILLWAKIQPFFARSPKLTDQYLYISLGDVTNQNISCVVSVVSPYRYFRCIAFHFQYFYSACNLPVFIPQSCVYIQCFNKFLFSYTLCCYGHELKIFATFRDDYPTNTTCQHLCAQSQWGKLFTQRIQNEKENDNNLLREKIDTAQWHARTLRFASQLKKHSVV